jgi:PAS domain S-box-containing protein
MDDADGASSGRPAPSGKYADRERSTAGYAGVATGRALLDHVPEMVTISDREGKIVYANPATERVSGYTSEEFASLDPFEQMHPEDRPRCEEAFRELLRTPGLSLQIEHRVRHKDGTWHWVEVTFASLFEDPEVGRLLATVRDVTEGKRAEAALSVDGDEAAVPPPVREQAYLVVREAVRNAVAHSGCERIGVSLEVDTAELRGRVEDDGSGFDPHVDSDGERNDREDSNSAARLGLTSMRERAELLGGLLALHSEPGLGTTVEVRVPLAN